MRGVAMWIGVAFLSILIHELGHALVMRRFGDRRVEIVLYAFGGFAAGSSWHSRREQILISAAGPAAQILGGAIVWLLALSLPPGPPLMQYAIGSFLWVSFFWAFLNLLPVLPLDGGRITEAVLGPQRERTTLSISLVCAGALAIYMLAVQGQIFAALFFGMLAYNNVQALNRRPEVPWMNVR
jgi:Zn-dependent protease